MLQELVLNWDKNMCFSSNIDGHYLTIDAADEFGGENKGPRPKKMLLLALAGCTAMDVVSLMKKMRVDFSGFKIEVESELADDHPKRYNSITLVYSVNSSEIFRENIEKAIKLSEEKYCGVWASLKDSIKIDYKLKIIE
jgi:putative redox protein